MLPGKHEKRLHNFAGAVLAALSLFAVYLFVYDSNIESGDTLRLFDVASSLVRYGDDGRDESFWDQPPDIISLNTIYPLGDNDIEEPLPALLASLLYRIGDVLPVGYVHLVWLLSPLALSLAAALFFLLVLQLGYQPGTAFFATLLMGAFTVLLPYSKTLFRDVLLVPCFLLIAVALIQAKSNLILKRWRSIAWAMLATLGFAAALQIKTSAVLALPGLLVLLLPVDLTVRRWLSWTFASLLVGVLALIATLAYLPSAMGVVRELLNFFGIGVSWNWSYAQNALHTHLFSIGGSLWGTSPLLLLAVPGAYWLWRNKRANLVWMVVLLIVGYALGHALRTGEHWFGGLSWPPRFLIPVVPFVMLLLLPVIDGAVKKRLSVVLGLIVFATLSLWIQAMGVMVPWDYYPGTLPAESQGLLEWSDGLNRVEYLRWLRVFGAWNSLGYDFAWARAGMGIWALALVLFVVFPWILFVLRYRIKRGVLTLALSLHCLSLLTTLFLGLQALYTRDGDFRAANAALWAAMQHVEARADSGDVLLLADPVYAPFFMNYKRSMDPRVIVLPPQPGERRRPDETPAIESDNLDALIGLFPERRIANLAAPRAVKALASQRDTIWLLMDLGPYTPWARRPLEQYMARNHFFISEMNTGDPGVRLLEYHTAIAPLYAGYQGPERRADLNFGVLRMAGYSFVGGRTAQPGEHLLVSLYWSDLHAGAEEAIVAWFLVPAGANQPTLQGFDSRIAGGFLAADQTSVWDHRAVLLPADTPPGTYDIWIIVYRFTDNQPVRYEVVGSETRDRTIGVLSQAVRISSSSP